MAFGGELAMLTALGFVVLGPKRMQELLREIARWKSELGKLTQELDPEAHPTNNTADDA